MSLYGLLTMLIIGGLAGWIASYIMGTSSSILRNIGIGIIGAFVGSFLFGVLGIAVTGLLGTVISATAGAVVLLAVLGYFFK